jgi:hypothetical protein
MNSAKRWFSLGLIIFMIACLIVPASAITYCFDYALYRVDGKDHDGMSFQTLNDELNYHNYASAVTFDSSTPEGVQSAANSLRPGDIVFIGTDHVGYVNDDLSIDHYLQGPGKIGESVDVQMLISDPYYQIPMPAPIGPDVKRLNLNDNLPSMVNAHFQKNLPIYVRHSPGYTPSSSVIMTQSLPQTINECEDGGTNICGTWTLVGSNQYDAKWENGAKATLNVVSWDASGVVIERNDKDVSFSGHYEGQLNGNNIENGKVTWSQNGNSWSGTWNANW